jgi:transcription elongation factor Elf1
LDEPVDVYSGWIDACEELNKRKKAEAARRAQGSSSNNRADSGSPPPSHLNDRLDPFDEDEDDDY